MQIITLVGSVTTAGRAGSSRYRCDARDRAVSTAADHPARGIEASGDDRQSSHGLGCYPGSVHEMRFGSEPNRDRAESPGRPNDALERLAFEASGWGQRACRRARHNHESL